MACIDCKHHIPASLKTITESGEGFTSYSTETIPAHCGRGNFETWLNWWNKNGMKPGDEARLDIPECFEKTEFAESADKILTYLDRLEKIFTE